MAMPTATLFRFQYTATSPHRPGRSFTKSALFSSRDWFDRCLSAWTRLGFTFEETKVDGGVNAAATATSFVPSCTCFGTDGHPAYIEGRVGLEGSSDGSAYAMTRETAIKWAEVYKVPVVDLVEMSNTQLVAAVIGAD